MSKFNATNDNIEWSKWTWNPVTGCLHDCAYCYARDIANRFPQAFPNGFEPAFYPERLSAPFDTKVPKSRIDEPGINNVFVCSMADLFGEWVNPEWIEQILGVIDRAPQWNFLFLTKNPKRYLEFEFPENCWLGATADIQDRMDAALEVFYKLDRQENNNNVVFVSCEPLLEPITMYSDADVLDWLIIGGQSKTSKVPAMQPQWEWVEDLLIEARSTEHCRVYFKPNLTVRPMEYPE
ncbi:MAG: DUF5131 family protein [Lentisphaerae bacterium]|nr:DUF5131 family protein [Lentisphaerota bacterium]